MHSERDRRPSGPPSGPSSHAPKSPRTNAMRLVFLALGSTSLALGIAGALLPLLPTTPFVLLASWCFLRSSPALDARLRRLPWLGAMLTDWERHRAIRPEVRRLALLGMALGVTTSLAWGALDTLGMLAMLTLAGVGATVILRLRVLATA